MQTAIVNGTRKRQYHRLPDVKREAIRADYLAGVPWAEIERKHKSVASVVANAIAGLPGRRPALAVVAPVAAIPEPPKDERPVRADGESTQRYAGRVMAWKLRTDPEFREAMGRAKGDGRRRATHKRKMAALEAEREALAAEREALAAERAALAVPPAPVAAIEPPWGFQPPAPVEIPAPKPGFWRSIGMMLGIVR